MRKSEANIMKFRSERLQHITVRVPGEFLKLFLLRQWGAAGGRLLLGVVCYKALKKKEEDLWTELYRRSS